MATEALDPAVAATRVAVRDALRPIEADPAPLVLVACSGGADSIALACATAFIAQRPARRAGFRAGLVTVDHGLQAGSADRAARMADWAEARGFAPAVVATVDVREAGDGPEAAAREARYAALVEVAHKHGAAAVLVGHTRDDQAETVLLALARGAGPRGLAGMPVERSLDGVLLLRPFLAVSRAQTRAACAAQNVEIWDDPHNQEPRFARVRVRDAMSTLIATLGPDIVPNLARTAGLVAADNEALDAIAVAGYEDMLVDEGLDCAGLVDLPVAVRTRILRLFALDLGTPGGALSSAHIAAMDALVMAWRGQGGVSLPGGFVVARQAGRLTAAR
ncbi:MAG TPA: tRNA lysidine(34) synthetase TilS [Micromonosporaceae bacterium]|jgi:tRNA(Ile)-lysidine synthase